jgi:hypothetical protein
MVEAQPIRPSDTAVISSVPPTPPASAASGAALAGTPFEWPTSTRLTYLLTGNYRGDVSGGAQVEWLRSGSHYQVHLNLVIGPSFAPLASRRMSSDGDITSSGLSPRRYDQDTRVITRDPQRATVTLDPSSVFFTNGYSRPRPASVQDSASQFVQLAYLLSTQPEQLRVGSSIDIPLALPYGMRQSTYDVVGEEVIDTPLGQLPTIHFKPRDANRRLGDLNAEIWFAPQLRYLPARIRIEQDAKTFIDLILTQLPEIAD